MLLYCTNKYFLDLKPCQGYCSLYNYSTWRGIGPTYAERPGAQKIVCPIGGVANAFVWYAYMRACPESLETDRYMERLLRNFHGTRTGTRMHGDSTT